MVKHNVGNHYEFLSHVLEIVEIVNCGFGVVRYKLDCNVHGGCCTVPSGIKMECRSDELDTMKCVREVDPWYHPPRKSEVDWKRGDTAQVRTGWDRAGIMFTVLGPAVYHRQWWVPVEDPDEKYPDFHKEAGLKKVVVDKVIYEN